MLRSSQLRTAVSAVVGILLAGMTAAAEVSVSVQILGQFGLVLRNGTALVPVAVQCSGGEPLEALLTLSQDDQTIYNQGSIGTVICDGAPHFSFARVTAIDTPFHPGEAYASAYVLVCAGNDCFSAGDSATIFLRRPR